MASPVGAAAALGSFFSSVSWSLLCFVEAEKRTKRAPVLLSAAPPDEYAYFNRAAAAEADVEDELLLFTERDNATRRLLLDSNRAKRGLPGAGLSPW